MQSEIVLPIVGFICFYILIILAGINLILKEKRFTWGTTFIFVGVTPILLGLFIQIGIIKEKEVLFMAILLIVMIYSFIIGRHQGNPDCIATREIAKE